MAEHNIGKEKKNKQKLVTLYSITNYAYVECDGRTCYKCRHDKMRQIFDLQNAFG